MSDYSNYKNTVSKFQLFKTKNFTLMTFYDRNYIKSYFSCKH